MANIDELNASKIDYSDLRGRYIFRKQMRFVEYDTTRLYKMDLDKEIYFLSGNDGWVCRDDLFGEISGLTGDNYEYIVLTKEQAIEKAKEWNINPEGLFD